MKVEGYTKEEVSEIVKFVKKFGRFDKALGSYLLSINLSTFKVDGTDEAININGYNYDLTEED